MAAYGDKGSTSRYEYDRLIPLELGGAVNAAGNLWPEPDYTTHSGFYLNPKDHLEYALKHLVCSGKMPLLTAQELIADGVSQVRVTARGSAARPISEAETLGA
jgi:hypothetical protein